MERSGRSAKPGGRSCAGVGRTWVSMWRRPSLPRVAHGTRLPGPPLRVGPVHRAALVAPEHGLVGGRTGLDAAHRPLPDVRRGHGDQPQGGRVRHEAPQVRAAGQHLGEPPAGGRGQRVLRVGDRDQPALHPRGDEGRPRQRWRRRGVRLVVRARHPAASVDHEGDGQAQGHGHRQPGHPPAGTHPLVDRAQAHPRRLEAEGCDPGRARAPSGLAHPAARHGLTGVGRQEPAQRQPDGYGSHVQRQRQGSLPGREVTPPVSARGAGQPGRDRLEGVLGAEGEQVVHPGRQPRHQALVDGAAGGQAGAEGPRDLGRGDDEPHLHPDVRGQRPDRTRRRHREPPPGRCISEPLPSRSSPRTTQCSVAVACRAASPGAGGAGRRPGRRRAPGTSGSDGRAHPRRR